jgi:hypothetical protein
MLGTLESEIQASTQSPTTLHISYLFFFSISFNTFFPLGKQSSKKTKYLSFDALMATGNSFEFVISEPITEWSSDTNSVGC